ncbi:MAG: beta-lactamase family protein [Planctomycetes bacterium]|nr:beta-lactamase family protein [Planctomycetota bacterium]
MTEGSPGFAIAVISQGELIFLKGYGLAEIKSGRSIDVDSSFRLASVSKQFTAIAIAMLAERGKLKYEDDVSLYLKKLPWKGVTIHHLI